VLFAHRTTRAALALLLLAGCRRDAPATAGAGESEPPAGAPAAAVHVEAVALAGGTRLTLVPAFGVRISARLAPALALAAGDTVRFGDAPVTEDGDYFTAPPSATLPRPLGPRGTNGVLRASVCDVGERVCRPVTVPL
jgi:hypothetical protein